MRSFTVPPSLTLPVRPVVVRVEAGGVAQGGTTSSSSVNINVYGASSAARPSTVHPPVLTSSAAVEYTVSNLTANGVWIGYLAKVTFVTPFRLGTVTLDVPNAVVWPAPFVSGPSQAFSMTYGTIRVSCLTPSRPCPLALDRRLVSREPTYYVLIALPHASGLPFPRSACAHAVASRGPIHAFAQF
jgi:hypothetical protein